MFKKFISAFLVLLYLTVTAGVAVHECGCGNSGKLELFVAESSCSCHHSAEDCCHSHKQCEHNHNSNHSEQNQDSDDQDCHGCHCATVVLAVDVDGIAVSAETFTFEPLAIAAVLAPAQLFDLNTASMVAPSSHSPPRVAPVPVIYKNCQLRL